MNRTLPSIPPLSIGRFLWNPFHYVAGTYALALGLLIVVVAGAIGSVSNAHFDGVLDTHIGKTAPLGVFLVEGVINWLCLSVFLWLGALVLKDRAGFRALDLFGTQALARWPFLIIALLAMVPGVTTFSERLAKMAQSGAGLILPNAPASETVAFLCGTLLMLIATVWFVALAWKAFRVSCDVSGGKAIATFVIALLVAEVVSKIAIGVVIATFSSPSVHATADVREVQALEAAEAWLELVDGGDYGASWEIASPRFRKNLTQERWITTLTDVLVPKGAMISRRVLETTWTESLPGAPPGPYVVIRFATNYEHKPKSIETITPRWIDDGWKVSGYFIK